MPSERWLAAAQGLPGTSTMPVRTKFEVNFFVECLGLPGVMRRRAGKEDEVSFDFERMNTLWNAETLQRWDAKPVEMHALICAESHLGVPS